MNIVGVSGNYNILWDDDVINVDTSEAAVSLYLPNIASGQVSKNFYINDVTGNAGTNAITILAADNTVNGGESTQIDTNNGSGECVISGSTEWIVNKNTDGGSSVTHKVYTALLTQEGTSAPVATVLTNTIGVLALSRLDAGQYQITSNELFTENKTFLFIGKPLMSNPFYPGEGDSQSAIVQEFAIQYLDSSTIVITTTQNVPPFDPDDNSASDEVLYNTEVEIRVYP